METVTYWSTLIQYAKEQAAAEKSGDQARIAEATKRHQDYKALCLSSDKMVIPDPRPSSGNSR
jgi:hypothetical protein